MLEIVRVVLVTMNHKIFRERFQLCLILGVPVMLFVIYTDLGPSQTKDVTGIFHGSTTKSDFFLAMENVTVNPTITYISIGGGGYIELCPSNQCTIEYGLSNRFYPPTPESPAIAYQISFKLVDNKTNELGPDKKDQFSGSMFGCNVYHIEKDNNQELYYCRGGTNGIEKEFDGESWYYNSGGIYDARAETFTITGNYSHSATFFPNHLG